MGSPFVYSLYIFASMAGGSALVLDVSSGKLAMAILSGLLFIASSIAGLKKD